MDLKTGFDAPGIGKQNSRQQDGRIVGPTTGILVAVTGVEERQVELVLNQVMNRVLEGARLELMPLIDHQDAVLIAIAGPESGLGFRDRTLLVCLLNPIKPTGSFGFSTVSTGYAYPFRFQTPEQPFHRYVVPAVATPAHALGHSITPKPLAEFTAGILAYHPSAIFKKWKR